MKMRGIFFANSFMISERQKTTFLYMLIAAFISAFTFSFLIVTPPILTGFALTYSNRNYLKYRTAIIVVPTLLLFWYLMADITTNEDGISDHYFYKKLILCYSSFVVVFLVTRLALKLTRAGLIQIFLLISLPVTTIWFISYIGHTPFNDLRHADIGLTVLSYGIAFCLLVTSMVKKEEPDSNA